MPYIKNPFRKENYVSGWIGFYWLFIVNMMIFTVIALLVEPIWNDINQFLGNAIGLMWNWLAIILVVSVVLILYGGYLSVWNLKKKKAHKEDSPMPLNVYNKIIPLVFFLGWNFMLYVLIDEGGEELRVMRPVLEYFSPILFGLIMVSIGVLIPPTLRLIKSLSFSDSSLNRVKSTGIILFLILTNVFGMLLPIIAPPVNAIKGDLPDKPLIMAHRGASYLAPENTLIAGELAAEWGAVGWEVDISISLDGVLFLCHDNTLKRTTNVEEIFPDRIDEDVTMYTMEDLRKLDAGSWFVDEDPYNTIRDGYVSQVDAERYRGENIPTLAEVINLTREYNLYLDIDAGLPSEGNPYRSFFWGLLMDQLYDSGLGDKIMVNTDSPLAENMTTVGTGRDMINTHHALTNQEFRSLEEQEVIVMVWTVDSPSRFSQLWCLGVDFVKTNSLHILLPLDEPTWVIPYQTYFIVWISIVFVCIAAGLLIFLIQNRKTVNSIKATTKAHND
ncbi:MAG: glycerophosphodiester phosphodiesterase family protein [Promethearchaeota archaeon]